MSLRLMFHPERAAGALNIVTDNDSYFMTVTINKLDEKVDGLLKHAEDASYVDEMTFEDQSGNRLPWYKLSIGSKTVLNVFYNPDICFSQIECNKEACANLKNLKEGCITPGFLYDLDGDDVCDVVVDDDPARHYTNLSKIHSGSGVAYNKGIVSIDLSYGFNIIKNLSIQDKEFLLQGLKCYEDAPVVKHICTKLDYQRFLTMGQAEDVKNTIFFLDRFALFGNAEVIGKCRDFKQSVVLLECTGFVDSTYIMPRANIKIEHDGKVLRIASK